MTDTTDAAARKPGPYDTVTIRDVFAWLDTLRGWDIATHVEYEALRDAALRRLDEAEAEARALDADLEDAQVRTPEERGLMICPLCNGTSPSGYTDVLSLEPSYPCGGCEGARYINPSRLAAYLVRHPDDPWGAFAAAVLTDEEGDWV